MSETALAQIVGGTRAQLELTGASGRAIPAVARAVQERAADVLAATCELEVDSVDVSVEEPIR